VNACPAPHCRRLPCTPPVTPALHHDAKCHLGPRYEQSPCTSLHERLPCALLCAPALPHVYRMRPSPYAPHAPFPICTASALPHMYCMRPSPYVPHAPLPICTASAPLAPHSQPPSPGASYRAWPTHAAYSRVQHPTDAFFWNRKPGHSLITQPTPPLVQATGPGPIKRQPCSKPARAPLGRPSCPQLSPPPLRLLCASPCTRTPCPSWCRLWAWGPRLRWRPSTGGCDLTEYRWV